MKKYIYMSMALAATMFAGCNSDDNDIQASYDEGITVYAQLPQEIATRVAYADESSGSTYSVKPSWEENDNIRFSYWWKNSGSEDKEEQRNETGNVNIATGEATIAKTPLTNTYVYAYYPTSMYGSNFNGNIPNSTGDYITFSPGRVQYNVCKDLDELKVKNILIGGFQYSGSKTNVVNLHNVYALLKFSVKVPTTASTLPSITIGRLNNNKNGRATIYSGGKINYVKSSETTSWTDTSGGSVGRLSDDNSTYGYISLSGDGEYKEAVFYALIIPQEFTNGLYLEVNDGTSKYYYLKEGTKTLAAGYMYGIKAKMTTTMTLK